MKQIELIVTRIFPSSVRGVPHGLTLRSSGTRLFVAVLKICCFSGFGGFVDLPLKAPPLALRRDFLYVGLGAWLDVFE